MGFLMTGLVLMVIAYGVYDYHYKKLEVYIEKEKTKQAWIETVKDWDGRVLIIPDETK